MTSESVTHEGQIKVFITYSWDTKEHEERVQSLANSLRGDGIDCDIDKFDPVKAEGLPRWMEGKLRGARFALCVCTESYCRRFEGREVPGKGLGANFEGRVITQAIYEAGGKNEKFIPVLFLPSDVQHIPEALKGAIYYILDSPSGYEELYRRLTDQVADAPAPVGALKKLPQRQGTRLFAPVEEVADAKAASSVSDQALDVLYYLVRSAKTPAEKGRYIFEANMRSREAQLGSESVDLDDAAVRARMAAALEELERQGLFEISNYDHLSRPSRGAVTHKGYEFVATLTADAAATPWWRVNPASTESLWTPELSASLEAFRKQRIAVVSAGGVRKLHAAPKLILHVLPVTSLSPRELHRVELSGLARHWYHVVPPGHIEEPGHTPNDAGFLTFLPKDGAQPSQGYVQVFKNGSFEGVSAGWGARREGVFGPQTIEIAVIDALDRYITLQEALKVRPPMVIALTLIDLEGLRAPSRLGEPGNLIQTGRLEPTEVLLPDFDTDPAPLLRSAFDEISRAAFFQACASFDGKTGKWKHPTGAPRRRTYKN